MGDVASSRPLYGGGQTGTPLTGRIQDRWFIDLILSHPEGLALLAEFHEIATRVEAEHRAKLARCPAALVDWVPPGDLDYVERYREISRRILEISGEQQRAQVRAAEAAMSS